MIRLGIGVVPAALAMSAAEQRAQTSGCDSACLSRVMSGFVEAMTTGAPGSVPLAEYVVADYVWKLDPLFAAVLPPEQRMTRVDLEALARRYFHALSTHAPVASDFDEHCDRYHSGQRITNAGGNTVEGGPPRTCAGSMAGDRPWGPATEQRFPVIDPEHGAVVGITLLHYPKVPNQPRMYVSEVFKVVSGRIVKIDNIGLMLPGVDTLGFIH